MKLGLLLVALLATGVVGCSKSGDGKKEESPEAYKFTEGEVSRDEGAITNIELKLENEHGLKFEMSADKQKIGWSEATLQTFYKDHPEKSYPQAIEPLEKFIAVAKAHIEKYKGEFKVKRLSGKIELMTLEKSFLEVLTAKIGVCEETIALIKKDSPVETVATGNTPAGGGEEAPPVEDPKPVPSDPPGEAQKDHDFLEDEILADEDGLANAQIKLILDHGLAFAVSEDGRSITWDMEFVQAFYNDYPEKDPKDAVPALRSFVDLSKKFLQKYKGDFKVKLNSGMIETRSLEDKFMRTLNAKIGLSEDTIAVLSKP